MRKLLHDIWYSTRRKKLAFTFFFIGLGILAWFNWTLIIACACMLTGGLIINPPRK